MATLKYYFDLMSQPSRALYVILKLTKIPFEPCPVALRKGEHRTDEFRDKFSRFQKVPFIHDGDFKLAESIAILRYLKSKYPDNFCESLYPNDSKNQAKVDEYLEWQHLNIRMNCSYYFWYKWILPNMTKSPPDENKIAELESNMIGSVKEFVELFLDQGHKYIAGDNISAADIFAACELEQPRIAGFDVFQEHPKLQTWLESVKRECNPYYQEAHFYVDKLAKKQLNAKL
ncbi:glutathione S-transferase theta-1-like [Rhynchophorus ferrugineus]|uniref:glutathione S-transferase theta-1-like n=1 Tax=Rhynchophorus ferrugineus TaxID=354439 RepID=UPI003FCED886